MSNQYAQLYQQQPSPLRPNTTSHQNGNGSQPLRTSHLYPYQLQHTQSPLSPIPSHYHAHSHPSQAAFNHQPIPAPSPQYPQQRPGVPYVGYSSPPTSPGSSGPSRRPLPTPGAPPSQFTSPLFAHPLPTPGPTPAPTSPQSHSRPLRAGSLPSSGTVLSSHQAASSLPSASPTSPTGGRRPLPLPRVTTGSLSDTAPRSSSPAKDVLKSSSASPGVLPSLPHDHPSSSSQAKFIPYWKRTLPDPSSERVPSASSSQEAVSPCVSGSPGPVASPDYDHQPRDRSKSFTGGRPLPPSPLDGSVGKPPFIPPTISVLGENSRALPNPSSFPVKASTSPPPPIRPVKSSSSLPSAAGSSPLFSNRPFSLTKPSRPISPATSDDDGKPSQNGKAPQKGRRPPSPQYGILDLPPESRSVISRNSTKHFRTPASIDHDRSDELPRGRSIRSPTLPQTPIKNPPAQHTHRSTRSAIVQLAPALPSVAGSSRHADSTPTSPAGWPNTLPRPPRAPLPGAGERPIVNRTRSSRQEYVNLDDAPPPSLRRSPSPSAVSSRTVPRLKTRSMASTPQRRFTQDPPVTPRRSAASVPSSPEKVFVSLPQVASGTTHPGNRSRSVTPANAVPERPRTQLPPAPRPPPSAFSQRFVSGKPAPAEPQVTTTRVTKPQTGGISGHVDDNGTNPSIFVSEPELPQITFSDPTASSLEDDSEPSPIDDTRPDHGPMPAAGGGRVFPPASSARRGGGLACGGCGGPIVGRIVSAMGVRWHPGCFRCSDCNDLLEYVSSYERDGKPFCHFDYHERFAPRCYHCKTAIVDERFITLDDPELGKRTYHEQHFFCSECGDPFLAPSVDRQNAQGPGGGVTFKGDGEFENDDVGFTVYKGYPYCESCHVRLRSPRCKRCKDIIRDGMQAVEALGGKYHWQCFCCTGCDKPFEDPAFFLRDNKPFCEQCYSIILKSEM
ncbi:hypothetical protein BC827DRAFT_183841 [Russula dissimulans]|nr:hypothetical protein BC827DRAFT_183841 [Russula dissimulans]